MVEDNGWNYLVIKHSWWLGDPTYWVDFPIYGKFISLGAAEMCAEHHLAVHQNAGASGVEFHIRDRFNRTVATYHC